MSLQNNDLAVFDSLIKSESHELSLLSNITALLFEYLNNVNWVGFYLNKDNNLILGPFQGKVACNYIEYGKGVCGTAMKSKKTIVVPDVNLFPGHIVCDSASKSEVVIPIILNNKVYGVLDIDSFLNNNFDSDTVSVLEKIVKLLEIKLNNITKITI